MPTLVTEGASPGMRCSAPPETPLLVACHDAGAANLIFAWLRQWIEARSLSTTDLLLVLEGPARDIAQRTGLVALGTLCTLGNLPTRPACVLSGTGWQSDWEHHARRLATMRNIHSIAVIDHWVNYPARFVRDGEACLPDEVWVSDEHAERIAKQALPALLVRRQPNLYLAHEVARIPHLPAGRGDTLYLLEPTRTNWGKSELGEFQALDYFIRHRHLVTPSPESRVRLRLHPAEPQGKYDDWIITNHSKSVCIDNERDLSTSIGRASVVIGIQTAAMIIAMEAGRAVYSSLPPWAGEFALPHEGIKLLRKLDRSGR